MARPADSSRETFNLVTATFIVAMIVMRCLVVLSPHLAFGTDPLLDPTAGPDITPLGMMLWDAAVLLACAVALLHERRVGRSIDWRLMGLALAPLPVLAWHASQSFDDLWRGAGWFSAVISAATLAHLARDRGVRASAAAVLVAVIAPLVIRGASQVFIEHAETLRYYREHRLDVLAAQGIEPGSNAAAIFERRLMQPEATGWFPLANVFGSFMVAGVVVMLGLLVAAVRARTPSGWWGVLALGLAGAIVGLILCGSKGAYAAAGLGVGVLGMLWLNARINVRRAGMTGGGLVMAAVIAAMLGVIVRGVVLPEGFAGEKSVLFRWHYAVASARIVADHPLTGAGPDGYQPAYVLHRLPNAPEEVASAHSVFLDWLASLGVWGLAWIVLAMLLVWRAGVRSVTPDEPADQSASSVRGAISLAMLTLAMAAALIVQEMRVLDGASLVPRIVGFAALIALALVLRRVLLALPGQAIAMSLAAGAAALLAHGQIELTFTQPGAAGWALALLGVAGAGGGGNARDGRPGGGDDAARATRGPSRIAWLAPGAVAAYTVLLITGGAVPAWRAKSVADEAARGLASLGSAARTDPARHRETRKRASDLLLEAHERLPGDWRLLLAAAEQRMIAGQLTQPAKAEDMMQALSLAERAMAIRRIPRTVAAAAGMAESIARVTGHAADWDHAIALRREAAGLDPHGLTPRLALADVLWESGRHDEAREQYRRVLAIDEAWRLDELKRLSESDRTRVHERTMK